ncbi:MAG: hypothetical protein JNL98_16500 [Bryobacterales bacterium]|nr:hypothetical protein [Bryobacterales bacterium]
MTNRRLFLCGLSGAIAAQSMLAAVRGDEVMYVGGTLQQIPEKTEGELSLEAADAAVFQSKKGEFRIPYKNITSIEYGQKAGRRVGAAVVVSPVLLLSKKRKHYLSVAYTDEGGNKQGAVFEVSKGKTHSITTTLETRSGKKVEFESDDARKHYEKESK